MKLTSVRLSPRNPSLRTREETMINSKAKEITRSGRQGNIQTQNKEHRDDADKRKLSANHLSS